MSIHSIEWAKYYDPMEETPEENGGQTLSQKARQQIKSALEDVERDIDSGIEHSEAQKLADEQARMFELVRRISDGEEVTPEEEELLKAYSSSLYQSANLQAVVNRASRQHGFDKLFDEENK